MIPYAAVIAGTFNLLNIAEARLIVTDLIFGYLKL
jgi:hypothetical protein